MIMNSLKIFVTLSQCEEISGCSFKHLTVHDFLGPMGSKQLLTEFLFIILLLLKKLGSARLRESDIQPISPKTPAPQY